MTMQEDFNKIIDYAHFWNWAPDWGEVQRIYEKFPDSYSVLTPFAYSYLEEMIRTTTSDYGLPLFDRNRQPVKVNVGMKLISLAIAENQNNQEYNNQGNYNNPLLQQLCGQGVACPLLWQHLLSSWLDLCRHHLGRHSLMGGCDTLLFHEQVCL